MTASDYIAAAPLVVLALIVGFMLIPHMWVLLSSRSCGGAKFGWWIVVCAFSWVGLAAFLIWTQAPKAPRLTATTRREPHADLRLTVNPRLEPHDDSKF
jgi:hypothetical protein